MTPEEVEIEREKLSIERAKVDQQKRQNNYTLAQFLVGGVAIALLGLFINWDKIVKDEAAKERELIVDQFEKVYAEKDPAVRVAMLERLDRATRKRLVPVQEELALSRDDLKRQQEAAAARLAAEEEARIAQAEHDRIAADKKVADATAQQQAEKKAQEQRLREATRMISRSQIFRW